MRRVNLGRLVPAPVKALVKALARRPRNAHLLTLIRRSVAEFRDDNCPQLAAAVSYHLLFSIFPLAIAAVGILGIVTESAQTQATVTSNLLTVLPLSVEGREQLQSMMDSISGAQGALGLLGLLGVVWSASGVMTAVRKAINIAWDIEAKRPFVRGKLMDLLLLAVTFVLLATTLGLVLVASIIRGSAEQLPELARVFVGPGAVVVVAVLIVALLTGLFVGLYMFLPATTVRFRDALAGALFSAVAIGALQLGFSVYVSHFASYNRVYGSLGAIIAFLFFVYLATMVFLAGAEIASELPRLAVSRDEGERQVDGHDAVAGPTSDSSPDSP